MRYRTRQKLLAYQERKVKSIQVRISVATLLKLLDLQAELPYGERGHDLGDAIDHLVEAADRRSRQQDPKVNSDVRVD